MTDEPSPKEISFIQQNRAEIMDIFRRENIRRERRSFPELLNEDKRAAVLEMMENVASGKRLRAFRFPELPKKVEGPIQIQPQGVTAINKKSTVNFEAVVCMNGFLLNVKTSDGLKPFIFRTEGDLMEIFMETVFPELEKLKAGKEESIVEVRREREVDDGRNTGADRWSVGAFPDHGGEDQEPRMGVAPDQVEVPGDVEDIPGLIGCEDDTGGGSGETDGPNPEKDGGKAGNSFGDLAEG